MLLCIVDPAFRMPNDRMNVVNGFRRCYVMLWFLIDRRGEMQQNQKKFMLLLLKFKPINMINPAERKKKNFFDFSINS